MLRTLTKKSKSALSSAERKIQRTFLLTPPGVFFYRKEFSVRNFGDELSPILVRQILKTGGGPRTALRSYELPQKLLAIGSILHFASDGDVIWGAGVNGKVDSDLHTFTKLDVRSVRGPCTRQFLLERGIDCPEVFGDPGLLMPRYFPKRKFSKRGQAEYIVIPNLNDLPLFNRYSNVVSPLKPLMTVTRQIINSRLVISSSLHGIILAEAYGVPAVLVLPPGYSESLFKYEDYYRGTGRESFPIADSVESALEQTPPPSPVFDADSLLAAFPFDFFYPGRTSG